MDTHHTCNLEANTQVWIVSWNRSTSVNFNSQDKVQSLGLLRQCFIIPTKALCSSNWSAEAEGPSITSLEL